MDGAFSQGKYHGIEHPLFSLIKLKKKALKNGANEKFIESIERRISIESQKSLTNLISIENIDKVVKDGC